jgi:hypothetical protein
VGKEAMKKVINHWNMNQISVIVAFEMFFPSK